MDQHGVPVGERRPPLYFQLLRSTPFDAAGVREAARLVMGTFIHSLAATDDPSLSSLDDLLKSSRWRTSVGSGESAFKISVRGLSMRTWNGIVEGSAPIRHFSFGIRDQVTPRDLQFRFDPRDDIGWPSVVVVSIDASIAESWVSEVGAGHWRDLFLRSVRSLDVACGYVGALFGPEYARYHRIQDYQIDVERVLPSYGWGTVIGPRHIKTLGGLSYVRELSGLLVEEIEGGRAFLQVPEDSPYDVADVSIQRMRAFLEPVLAKSTSELDGEWPQGFPVKWI